MNTTVTTPVVTDIAAPAAVATNAPKVPKEPKAPKVIVAKEPSKKSMATVIFQAKLAERAEGLYASNKDFRAAVLSAIETDLGVSTPSAATMYNAAKKEAEAAGTATLGRDPKKEKVAGTGKRGRPANSKNKAKYATATEPVPEVTAMANAVTAAVTADAVTA